MEMNNPSSSSSSSSSSSKQKTIYLWFQTLNGRNETEKKSTWYKLGPTEFNSSESDLTLVSVTNLNRASEAVAWGSIIYVLAGSSSNPARQVFHFDTLRPDIGWKLGPALIWPRTDVTATVKGRKIHALGEVETKQKSRGKKATTSFEERGEIIDPLMSTSSEENTRTKGESISEYDCSVAERGSDYYYHCSKVYLDRRVKNAEDYEVLGLDEGMRPPECSYRYGEYPAFLADVGEGRLCLMWESDRGLHCTKFRVSVYSDGRFVTVPFATVEAFRIFSNYERWQIEYPPDAERHWRYCLVL